MCIVIVWKWTGTTAIWRDIYTDTERGKDKVTNGLPYFGCQGLFEEVLGCSGVHVSMKLMARQIETGKEIKQMTLDLPGCEV